MFDSVLLLDRPQTSRLARAELAILVFGAHALTIAALIAAQAWRIDAVPFPSLPTPFFDPVLPIVFDETPPPARRSEPRRSPDRAPVPVAALPPAPMATPEQLAAAPVPSILSELSAPTAGGVADGAPSSFGDPGGSGLGFGGDASGAAIDFEGRGLVRPVILVRVEPLYPKLAQVQRRNGSVLLRAEISSDGLVRGAEVLHVSPKGFGFEQSALDAVRQWRFRPATTPDGRPVAVLYRLQVTFTVR